MSGSPVLPSCGSIGIINYFQVEASLSCVSRLTTAQCLVDFVVVKAETFGAAPPADFTRDPIIIQKSLAL